MTTTPELPHILVLEDDPTQLRVLTFNLEHFGWKVTVAVEATEALELAKHDHFDLVIADYNLPDHLGTDFIRALREDDGYRYVPVILLTGRAEELDEKYLREELAVLLMSKPCSMSELADTVAESLAMAPGTS